MWVCADRLAVGDADRQHQQRDHRGDRERQRQSGAAAEDQDGEQRLRPVRHGGERVGGQDGERDQLAHPLVRDRGRPERRAEHEAEQPAPEPGDAG